jgi:hypothetical protein
MPYAVVNPSGTCERHGLIQVRLDFCLEPGDARYDDPRFYVIDEASKAFKRGYEGKDELGLPVDAEAYKAWRDSLPRVWLAERTFHHHMVYLDPYTLRDEQIEQAIALHLPNFYKAWVDEWDKVAGGMRHGWDTATRKRPTRFDVKEPERYAERKALCLTRLPILAALSFATRVVGLGETFPSTDIDVGSAATDRASNTMNDYTWILVNNPANDTGALDTIEVWANSNLAGFVAGTFDGSGTSYTPRDSESIGNVTSGSKQSFTGLDISIETGDLLGYFTTTGYAEADYFGGAGCYYKSGNQFAAGTQTYASIANYEISLYGTGDTEQASHTSISIGALLRATDTESVSIDALLKTIESGSVDVDALLVDRTPSQLTVDALLKGVATTDLAIDSLLQDTDNASLSIDAILVDQSYSAPYYIEVRDSDGVLLGTIKDILTGSLEQETNMPDVLSLAIPLNEIRASLITRKNELWVRDSVTDTVLSICKVQIAEESDG